MQREETTLVSYTNLSKNDGWWIQPAIDSLSRFQALRAQLIDRCEKVKDTLGNYDRFTTGQDAEGRPLIDVEHRGHDREDSPETAREMSAAYAFWAWELDQCQREATSTAATTQQQP